MWAARTLILVMTALVPFNSLHLITQSFRRIRTIRRRLRASSVGIRLSVAGNTVQWSADVTSLTFTDTDGFCHSPPPWISYNFLLKSPSDRNNGAALDSAGAKKGESATEQWIEINYGTVRFDVVEPESTSNLFRPFTVWGRTERVREKHRARWRFYSHSTRGRVKQIAKLFLHLWEISIFKICKIHAPSNNGYMKAEEYLDFY